MAHVVLRLVGRNGDTGAHNIPRIVVVTFHRLQLLVLSQLLLPPSLNGWRVVPADGGEWRVVAREERPQRLHPPGGNTPPVGEGPQTWQGSNARSRAPRRLDLGPVAGGRVPQGPQVDLRRAVLHGRGDALAHAKLRRLGLLDTDDCQQD